MTLDPNQYAADRFRVFSCEVIQPAIYTDASPLSAAIFQCPEPIPHDQAVAASYRPVDKGLRWGPVWSTAWFHVTGRVPASMAGRNVAFRFDTGTEGLLWRNGVPHQGFDVNRDTASLYPDARGGELVDLHVEAACNHLFGNYSWGGDPEIDRRWREDDPGRLDRCELAVFHEEVWRLWRAYEFAGQLLAEVPAGAHRGAELNLVLSEATRLIDPHDVEACAGKAIEILHSGMSTNTGSVTRGIAVGHAHIDTAWLWPLRETRRKCQRSFASVLRLMERFADFNFLCSQAAQYEYIEEDSPELFEEIRQRVAQGRWEPAGAMWVEADGNVPCGESFVRQLLFARRYWRERFGEKGEQRLLYLPDTFGFSAALPTILRAAGIDTLITNKLSWNRSNAFPFMNFRWRGLDGSEVLAHCTPGHDYNATNSPRELRHADAIAGRQDRVGAAFWLQPFGYGDGGGGPTDWMIENARLAASCDGIPRFALGTAGQFCEALHAGRAELNARGRELPVWDGELYLELHRGTLTTQAWLKKANRRAERNLVVAEWLSHAGPLSGDGDVTTGQLHEAWKLVLLNQFHDILPGSSISRVYEDARRDFDRVEEIYRTLIAQGLERWVDSLDTTRRKVPVAVFNATSHPQNGIVETSAGLRQVSDVPAYGVKVVDIDHSSVTDPVRVEGFALSNGLISASIDVCGRVASLLHVPTGRESCMCRPDGTPVPMNQLVLYEDRPRDWDAWDIDAEYEELGHPLELPVERREVVSREPLRAVIEVERPVGHASRMTQRFVLEANSPRLDIETRVEWHEHKRLLRALFPAQVRTRNAIFGIQNGYLERPATTNNTWEQAAFEVCAHGWMAVEEYDRGVALLNDCKYGHSCRASTMGLSLLRSPKSPDDQADMGEHCFVYSLMPYAGDWRAAGVDRQAELLNCRLLTRGIPAGQSGRIADCWAPFSLLTRGGAGVSIGAIKKAEEGDGLVLRLVETHGGSGELVIDWHLPVAGVRAADVHESPTRLDGLTHDESAGRTTVMLRPFQLVTLVADRLGAGPRA